MIKICQNCRELVQESTTVCPVCGSQNFVIDNTPVSASQAGIAKDIPAVTSNKTKSVAATILVFAAILFYIMAIVMAYKGHDKMMNYRNPDSSFTFSQSVNAYVGGDAYNYIINGNYATGFFVLSSGFLISGTLCIGFSRILAKIS